MTIYLCNGNPHTTVWAKRYVDRQPKCQSALEVLPDISRLSLTKCQTVPKICRTIFIVKNVVIISQSGISKICLKPWFNINMSSYQYMKSVWKPIAEIKTIEPWFPILIKHIYIESGPLKFYSNIPVANELNNFLVIIKHVFLDY